MEEILTRLPGWSNEILGFNQGSLLLLTGILFVALFAKLIAALIISRFLSTFCEGHELAEKAVLESKGSLGSQENLESSDW